MSISDFWWIRALFRARAAYGILDDRMNTTVLFAVEYADDFHAGRFGSLLQLPRSRHFETRLSE